MPQLDSHNHLNDDSKLKVELSIPDVAKQVCSLNYGAHRLLSAMVHELRAKNNAENLETEKRGLKVQDSWRRSPLADIIESALNQGHYY